MTPEELARLQAGLDPRAYYPEIDLMRQARAGQIPVEAAAPRGATTIVPKQTSQDFLQNFLGRAKTAVAEAPAQVRQKAKSLRQRYPNAGRYAVGGSAVLGAVPGVMTAYEQLKQNRPAGAAGALVGAGAQAGVSALGTKLLMGASPLSKVAGLGLLGVGALIPEAAAQGTEYVQSAVRGVPIENEQSFVNELRKQQALGTGQLDLYGRQVGIDTSAVKDLTRFYSDQAYTDLQRNIPLINKIKDAELVRNQALMASRGNQLARLSLLQTGGALATGGQAETGATVRTMIQSNPYAAATVF